MRVLDTNTLEFREFYDEDSLQGKYAILSHRWLPMDEGSEATYKEFRALCERPEAQWTASVRKVKTFCDIAKSKGLKWAWSDTCCTYLPRYLSLSLVRVCAGSLSRGALKQPVTLQNVTNFLNISGINKDSESELAESINSMWKWYAKSALCVVYLPDVPSLLPEDERQEKIKNSEWFKRGWTLQELLAPEHMTFFNQAWNPIGTRSELANLISEKTGIESQYFGNLNQIKQASAATRLSWAAGRRLTRPEDVAYCLVGIMGVYVTPRYGSGMEEAFRVLQIEFTKKNLDQSIFAWELGKSAKADEHYGLFAPSPDAFANTGKFQATKRSVWKYGWKITDQGLFSGVYHVSHVVPLVGKVKALKEDIAISIDAVDREGRVPRLQLRKRNGIFYRVNADKLSLDGRSDRAGRSMGWVHYKNFFLLPLSFDKQMNIALGR